MRSGKEASGSELSVLRLNKQIRFVHPHGQAPHGLVMIRTTHPRSCSWATRTRPPSHSSFSLFLYAFGCSAMYCVVSKPGGSQVEVVVGAGVRVLVYPDVVEAHRRRQRVRDPRVVDLREALRHAQVGDYRHRLPRHHAVAHVAVGAHGAAVDLPQWVVADVPRHVALVGCVARVVVEGVSLVRLSVVPVVVQV